MDEEMENGNGKRKTTRVNPDELDDLCGYSDTVQACILDALDANPEGMVPAWLMAGITRALVTNMHINHSSLLRPYHDARWQRKHGDTRTYPVGGGYVPYENEETDDSN